MTSNNDLKKYDDMIFNPLRFDINSTRNGYVDIKTDDNLHKCSYITPDKVHLNEVESCNTFNLLNVNIRSIYTRALWSPPFISLRGSLQRQQLA